MSGQCAFAITDPMPDYFCVSVQGVANGTCTDCAIHNQNWLLTQTVDYCIYESVFYDVCSLTNFGKITLSVSNSGTTLVFYVAGGTGIIATYQELSAYPDVSIPRTLTYLSSTDACTAWPASLIITPTNSANCVGDPHFVGFENDRFDFHGVPNKTYNLLSDYNVSVNALFGDYTSVPGTTYLEEIGIVIGTKEVGFTTIRFSSKGVVYVNEKLMKKKKQEFPTGLGGMGSIEITMDSSWQSMLDGLPADGVFQNGIIVNTGNFKLRIPRFISELSHMSVFASLLNVPVSPHGIIGQTADFDGKPRIGTGPNGEGAVDGKPEDYEVKDLFSPDFVFSRFAIEENTKAA